MPLTKTERYALAEVVKKLRRGPSRGWDEAIEFERRRADGEAIRSIMATDLSGVKLWLDTWVTAELEQLLEHDGARKGSKVQAAGDG